MKRLPTALVLFAALVAVAPASAAELLSGVPNFYRVNGHVYRGGQPEDEGWAGLARLGVKTVIDLRREGEHSTAVEARAVEAAGMRYVNLPMNGFEIPQAEQISKAMALLAAPHDTVFVHCKLGKDRTGTVIAAYRIAGEKWEAQKALDEAEACGLHWFERGMKRFILAYKPTPAGEALAAEPPPAQAVPGSGTPAEQSASGR